ncbi:glycosyltransferase family 2 protein [Stakelama saccharophila]|uniref:Glycosyltransferase family A protein n=1 Tax=Stakelama saccharophila TaxID=3075605 RepID=A0ABZ0BBX7_9SPHN|nr:glycosyltransferase family A protein [Stakelama sp. W311]WNO54807.1 glycosyltransferase family A protein [Stakelama sp. W311]
MVAPTVSVLIAAYRGAPLIAETLDSLYAQTFSDFEVVIVDDCSGDETAALVRGYGDPRVRLIVAPENGGPVAARNRAFAAVRGRYVAGLDHDDVCRPDRLARQAAFLDANPDFVLVASHAELLVDGMVRPSPRVHGMTPDQIDWMMLTRNPLVWSSVMFRADAARRLDVFERCDRLYVEDFDLYHRLRSFGRIAEIDLPLVCYRSHAGGLSKRFAGRMLETASMVLAEAQDRLFGRHDADAIGLFIRHLMAREPVRDAATLERLFTAVAALRRQFFAAKALDDAARMAVDHDISQLWWRTCREAVRSGAMPLRRALATPAGRDAVRHARPGDLLMSEVIGRIRAVRQARIRA